MMFWSCVMSYLNFMMSSENDVSNLLQHSTVVIKFEIC